MPNIGTLLKEEISRLARKELRGEVEGIKKASAQYRRNIAALKRQVATLERQVSLLGKKTLNAPATPPTDSDATRVRFVAKGLRSHRDRLGLSAADYGKLAGVTAQSVYNWEHETARPRGQQLATLAALRGVGKKEAQARLQHLNGQGNRRRSKS